MTKIIQFPNKNFHKNTRTSVEIKSDKNKAALAISIFTLVLALSVFNNQSEQDIPLSGQRGMRGIASVDSSSTDLDQKKVLELIEKKASRRTTKLGRTPSSVDHLSFSPQIYGRYGLNGEGEIVTSIKIVDFNLASRMDESFLKENSSSFGGDDVTCGEPGEIHTQQINGVDQEIRFRNCNLLSNGEIIRTLAITEKPSGLVFNLDVRPIVQ